MSYKIRQLSDKRFYFNSRIKTWGHEVSYDFNLDEYNFK
jgi:hypothetical protein